jgi:hypothetical protein
MQPASTPHQTGRDAGINTQRANNLAARFAMLIDGPLRGLPSRRSSQEVKESQSERPSFSHQNPACPLRQKRIDDSGADVSGAPRIAGLEAIQTTVHTPVPKLSHDVGKRRDRPSLLIQPLAIAWPERSVED